MAPTVIIIAPKNKFPFGPLSIRCKHFRLLLDNECKARVTERKQRMKKCSHRQSGNAASVQSRLCSSLPPSSCVLACASAHLSSLCCPWPPLSRRCPSGPAPSLLPDGLAPAQPTSPPPSGPVVASLLLLAVHPVFPSALLPCLVWYFVPVLLPCLRPWPAFSKP